MGMGKFTLELGWGIFCGDGVGMGNISWGWGQFYLPCHSLLSSNNVFAILITCTCNYSIVTNKPATRSKVGLFIYFYLVYVKVGVAPR